jgi:ATP-dependent RNA helicase DeaD
MWRFVLSSPRNITIDNLEFKPGEKVKSFNDLNLSEELTRAITEMGFTEPSPIQTEALPVLLAEPTDFIGLAATGTGKTAAFGIPLLESIDANIKQVQAVVLCPTRELAMQVCGQINLLGKYKKIKALSIYGGAGYSEQIYGLKSGHQIVVGTPGRMVDHIERGTLKIENVKTIVLDEADKMISMGFKEELETILNATNREINNIWLFSATMDRDVRKVADTYLENPKQVQINRTEVLSATVEQIYYPARESDKPEILCKIIEAADEFYGVVFCQTKSLVTDLARYLAGRGYKVDSLHGDKSQQERERTMQSFRDKKVDVLVCTDVASRGLDVKDITHVINYSIPRELDVYVHRIGRTARIGKAGIAISLVTNSHRELIYKIEKLTKTRMTEGKIPSRRDVGIKKVAKMLEPFQTQKNFSRAVELLSPEWKATIEKMSTEEIVGRFLCAISPEIFENQEREKPLQKPVMTDSRGNALPNENRREGGTGRGRHRDNHSRGRGGEGRRGDSPYRGESRPGGGRDGGRRSEGRRDGARRDDGGGRGRSEGSNFRDAHQAKKKQTNGEERSSDNSW